jgi:hypothetical protein
MARTNVKTTKSHVYEETRLAGGYGPRAAKQPAEQQLRRAVMACLLWEDIAYADGASVAATIKRLVPEVDPLAVMKIAVAARCDQKLRHVPLLICREMARLETHKSLVAETLAQVIRRPDELCEFVSLYWQDNGGKKALSSQVKKGLARAFLRFDEYQLGKWNQQDREIKLRDVLFLCHAKPTGQFHTDLWKKLVDGKLAVPDTWEVGLSAAKSVADKCEVWTRLVESGKLPAFALMKNLRNMQQAAVPRATMLKAFNDCRPDMLLPIDFLKAAKYAPDWQREIENVMYRCAAQWPKLPGWSIFVVDVSGSMSKPLSSRSEFSRMEAATAMTVLAAEMCEQVSIYATAGDDPSRKHKTVKVPAYRGFALSEHINNFDYRKRGTLGGGGIFTRQCLEFIRSQEHEQPDRIIIFSDSADCDFPGSGQPKPFGQHNYIVDVSCEQHGIAYDGLWTAEISGWSEHFLRFIAQLEGQQDRNESNE